MVRRRRRVPVIQSSLLESYEAAAVANPLLTKSATSLVGFVVADAVAQTLSSSRVSAARLLTHSALQHLVRHAVVISSGRVEEAVSPRVS